MTELSSSSDWSWLPIFYTPVGENMIGAVLWPNGADSPIGRQVEEFSLCISYLKYSGITEDRETFMGTNGLRSNFLARGTHVLQVRICIFMSGM